MSRAKRTILALVLIELLLAGLWFYLAAMASGSSGASPDSGRVIGQTMGTAMGVVAGLAPFLYLFARSNDRKAQAKSEE